MYNKFLSGEKIYLREVRAEDVNDEYYNWINDPEINKFLETRFLPRSRNDILNYVSKLDGNPNEIFFAICDKNNNKHIGNIKLGPINWYHRKADISLLVGDKKYWGKGIASESISLVVEFAFNVLNLNKVCAGYYINNIGSAKAFEKCGFKVEGNFEDECYCNGYYVNMVRIGLLKKNYLNKGDLR